MKEKIFKLLMENGYSEYSAQVTVNDIAAITDADVRRGVLVWANTGKEIPVGEGEFTTESLMTNFGMKYPAALIFIDWYRKEPEAALDALSYQGGL